MLNWRGWAANFLGWATSAPVTPATPVVTTPIGGVSPRVWRQGIQTYLRRLEAEQPQEVAKELRQVRKEVKRVVKAIQSRETQSVQPVPQLFARPPSLQPLIEKVNAEIAAQVDEALALQAFEDDDEDAITVLLH